MPIFGFSPEICGSSDGLYSIDPNRFQEADAQLAELERRQEWPLLHGDGTAVKALNRDNGQQSLIGDNMADESEPLKLTA
jgi:hypothetical protein